MPNKGGKGSKFERDICKTLSLWWTSGENDAVFWRTAGSGGRATNRAKKGRSTANAYGDICALDPVGQPFLDVFCLELKKGYSTETLHALLDAPENAAKQTYLKWIEQAEASRKASGAAHWLLITQRDRRQTIVTLSTDGYSALLDHGAAIPLYLHPCVSVDISHGFGIRSYLLKDFLKAISPSIILDWKEHERKNKEWEAQGD